jgi:rhodanese-related sulfurtransferase
MTQLRLFLSILFLSLASCSQGQTVDVKTFAMGLTPEVQLLDVRTPEEYQEDHIKNATLANINDDESFEKVTGTLDKKKPVYIYCHSGRRSAKAAKTLKEKGFNTVVNLDGGIEAWKEAGMAVE